MTAIDKNNLAMLQKAKKNLSAMDLSGANLEGIDLSSGNLISTNFKESNLKNRWNEPVVHISYNDANRDKSFDFLLCLVTYTK